MYLLFRTRFPRDNNSRIFKSRWGFWKVEAGVTRYGPGERTGSAAIVGMISEPTQFRSCFSFWRRSRSRNSRLSCWLWSAASVAISSLSKARMNREARSVDLCVFSGRARARSGAGSVPHHVPCRAACSAVLRTARGLTIPREKMCELSETHSKLTRSLAFVATLRRRRWRLCRSR